MTAINEDLLSIMKSVEGWISPGEDAELYAVALGCQKDHVIVEIGSWKGLSTIIMATASKRSNGVQIYAVDPHHGGNQGIPSAASIPTLDAFMANIRKYGVENLVTPIVNVSEYAAKYILKNKKVGVVFIDATHTYEEAKKDFGLWYPILAVGGTMVFHDSTSDISFPECMRAVRECVVNSGKFTSIKLVGLLTIATKL